MRSLLTITFVLASFYGYAQKKEIKSNNDYTILNQTVERYFRIKNFRDSLYIKDMSDFSIDSINIQVLKEDARERKKLETLHIKKIADKILYKQFLEKEARWKKDRDHQKSLSLLNAIFSEDELANYNKQLADNYYVWSTIWLKKNDSVFINDELLFTQEELKNLPEDEKVVEMRKLYDLNKDLNLYTFSKPIYSIEKQYALIAYNSGGANMLDVYERIHSNWVFKLSISNNYLIDGLRP